MTATIIYALVFLLIPFGFFIILGWLILYHLKTYGLKKSFSEKARIIFILGILAISILAIKNFYDIDWENFSLEEITQDISINFSPENYE